MLQTEDIKFGLENENKIFPIISSFLNVDLKKTKTYDSYDWTNEDKTIYVELKSRRITYNKYNTTVIGLNKIRKCKNDNITYYFIFLFIDGLYYIKYDKDIFEKYRIENKQINYRNDVNRNEINTLVHIPINKLEKISF